MLAYVLWHHARAGISTRIVYEASLLAFHERLRQAGIKGFIASSTSVVSKLPWIATTDCREDWYIVDDWCALGAMLEASVSDLPKAAHDLVTHSSVIDGASIYRLRAGECCIDAPVAEWFSKPEGMAQWVMEELIEPSLQPGCGLWQRQLALGPAPEFCLLGQAVWRHPSIPMAEVKRSKLVSRGPSLLH